MIVLADSVCASTHLHHQVPMLIAIKNFALLERRKQFVLIRDFPLIKYKWKKFIRVNYQFNN